jgi:two-component system, cell cycle response regulator
MLRRILLIDDQLLQFRLLQGVFAQFRGERFSLEWAETYEDGLARLLAGGYAACLLDYQLGPRDGLLLLKAAVAASCHTPIIFLTAETSEEIDTAAMNAGALDYLLKSELKPANLERSLRYAFKLGETLALLRERATRDELTTLLNRREFDRLLADEVERSRRFGHSVALVILDLDYFKNVNDTHGHPAGDLLLQTVARVLSESVRSLDRVARIGGEEFAVILMQTERTAALEIAERLVATLREKSRVVLPSGIEIMATVSAGVAALPRDAVNVAGFIQAADHALYAAKAAGRDRALPA